MPLGSLSRENKAYSRGLVRWRLRPNANLDFLLGLSLAFLDFKKILLETPALLSLENRVVLDAIVVREEQNLEECVGELQRGDEVQYRHLRRGCQFGRTALKSCLQGDSIQPT